MKTELNPCPDTAQMLPNISCVHTPPMMGIFYETVTLCGPSPTTVLIMASEMADQYASSNAAVVHSNAHGLGL